MRNFPHDPKRVAALLGGEARGNHVSAPGPGHTHGDRSLSVGIGDDYPDGFVVKSFSSDDWRACRDYVRRKLGIKNPSSSRSMAAAIPERVVKTDVTVAGSPLAIWNDAINPRGTLAQTYLASRGITLTDDLCGRVLRFATSCPFGPRRRVPALIAAFHRLRGENTRDRPTAILRIGLGPDGTKLGKMMLGPVGGCAIKLDADEDVSLGLGVAEGLETALKVRATGWRPVWAMGSAGAIEKFPPLAGVEALTIFADHDKSGTGIKAARSCAERWADAGMEVFVRTPRAAGDDWADIA